MSSRARAVRECTVRHRKTAAEALSAARLSSLPGSLARVSRISVNFLCVLTAFHVAQTTQLNSQVQESKRQVDESKRQAAAAQEQVETCRLEIQHLQAARKTDQSLITDAQTKVCHFFCPLLCLTTLRVELLAARNARAYVQQRTCELFVFVYTQTHALEMRVQRHQRERAKLLDQIQRRDQVCYSVVACTAVVCTLSTPGIMSCIALLYLATRQYRMCTAQHCSSLGCHLLAPVYASCRHCSWLAK